MGVAETLPEFSQWTLIVLRLYIECNFSLFGLRGRGQNGPPEGFC